SRWKLVRSEIEETHQKYGDKRRTAIESDAGEQEYRPDDFIVEEDNVVIVSRDGWVKRQKEVKDLSTTRLREGDAVLDVLAGSTPVRAAEGGCGSGRRRARHRQRGAHRRDRRRPRPPVQSRRGELPLRAWKGRDSHQAGQRRPRAGLHRFVWRSRSPDRGDH